MFNDMFKLTKNQVKIKYQFIQTKFIEMIKLLYGHTVNANRFKSLHLYLQTYCLNVTEFRLA